MEYIYICSEPVLKENYPNPIVEKDSEGTLIGSYTGYYDSKRYTVRLYPQKHPFVIWRKKPTKLLISAALVKCTPRKEPSKIKKPDNIVYSQDFEQEKIKF